MTPALPRSYLYVPGDADEKLARASERGADAIIVDLEDGVAPAERASARRKVVAWLAQLPPADRQAIEIWVRVPAGEPGRQDVEALLSPALTGICLAKAEVAEVGAMASTLSALEEASGLAAGSTALLPLIETATAVVEVVELARGPRVRRLQIGEVDLAADLRLEPGEGGLELSAVRSAVVVASAAARLDPPIAAVSTDFRDLDRFTAETERLRRSGFYGRACIHPAQVQVANRAFSPTPAAVAEARSVLDAFDRAEGSGQGVAVGPDGRMLDEAVVRHARTVLERAGRQGAGPAAGPGS